MRTRVVAAVFSAVIAASTAFAQALPQSEPTLRIIQLDVGQGEATLITTLNGRHVLIDAGPRGVGVAEWLVAAGIDTLDLVIATHAHADHIGGMADVLSQLVIRAYVDNGLPHTTATYRRTMIAVEGEPDITYLAATRRTITVDSTHFRILPPAGVDTSQNNNSVGVLVTHGEFRALFTGDSEIAQLSDWLATDTIPHVHVLKAAHHGARNGVTADWARTTAPRVVMIPVGWNSYGHPSPAVLELWVGLGAEVVRTDYSGSIEVLATRDGLFTVRTER